jgi:hypothetical protein
MMEAVRTSETSVDNHFTRQYNPEDSSEHHTRRRENLKSHGFSLIYYHKKKLVKYEKKLVTLAASCIILGTDPTLETHVSNISQQFEMYHVIVSYTSTSESV